MLYDLDLTLIDTSSVEVHRKSRNWRRAKDGLPFCPVYDGIADVLRSLHGPHAKGIVTTSPRPYAELAATIHDLPSVLVAYHDVFPRKPHPAPLLEAASMLGKKAAELAYVGDTSSDVAAAKRAGMLAVAAMWGAQDMEALEAAEPDVVVRRPRDLALLMD